MPKCPLSWMQTDRGASLAEHDRNRVAELTAQSVALSEPSLAEGPPFDLVAAGIDRHNEVFLTTDEVTFVFSVPEGIAKLERILADPEFWEVVSSWEHIITARPRVAEVVFDWCANQDARSWLPRRA
jgi:hypothetical protein